jgi:hypothetical protein
LSTHASAATTPHVVTPLYNGKEIDLARSTVYLEFSLHMLGTSRQVPQSLWSDLGIVTNVEENEDGAEKVDKALIKVSKELFDSETLSAIRSFDGHTREWIRKRCLPFKRGVHFLPLSLTRSVDQWLKRRNGMRKNLVNKFLQEYPDLCKDIAKRLTKKYYNVADYPAIEDVAAQFSMSWRYFRFGVPEALAEVDPTIFEEERQKAAADLSQAAEEIKALMRAEALKLVKSLRDALSPGPDGRKKKLYDCHFTNLAEYLALFDHRNRAGDSDLKPIVDELRARLRNSDAEIVRNNKDLRAELAKEMTTITDQLNSMVERVPRRRITLH